MATHDYVISNQSFPSTRTDINNVLQAIVSNNSNATAPSTTYANMIWYDTANNKLYIRNEDNDAWIELLTLDQVNDKLASLNLQGGELILDADGDTSITADTDDRIDFRSGGSDTAHVTSTDFLVGKTTTAIGTAGSRLINNGQIQATASGNEPYFANRLSSDGVLFDFRKDGTTVGNIISQGSARIAIGTDDTGVIFNSSNESIHAWNITANTNRTDNIDLGNDSNRFKNLYLSGSVYLGGTAAANALDDYEEGTFTPANAYVTITVNSAAYVKVGNIVIYRFDVSFPTNSNTNIAILTGFPFNSPSYNGGFTHWTDYGAPPPIHITGTTAAVQNPASASSTLQLQNLSGKRIICNAVVSMT